jgi:hypothetical protein
MHIDEFLGKEIDIDFMFYKTDFISACLEDCGFRVTGIFERDPYRGVEYDSRRAYIFAGKPG